MRLLVLTEYFPTSETEGITGGVESRALHLFKELAKRHSVTILCSLQPKQQRLSNVAGIKVIRVGPVISYSNKGEIFKRFLFALSAMLTAFILPTDVIEAYSYLLYPATSIVGNLRSKRRVVTYHESWTPHEWIKLKGWWTGLFGIACTQLGTLLGFDQYIAVSETTKQQLVKQGIPARKISVVHNGVDMAFFKQISARTYAEPSIMCSARLIKSKRVDVLVEAVALL
jgi:glycosyltransferase involved in cell wall biosynthesis